MNKLMFFLIVLLSALFRVTNLDIIEFKIDEASNLLLASLPLFEQGFAPAGIVSSVGILNTPLFNYLLFPVLLISLNPEVVVFFIAIVNALANGFFYLIIKKNYNKNLAIITTLLIAFSPWSILFSRKIWPPDFIFPMFVVLFLSIHKILLEKKLKFWISLVFSSLFLIQLEMASAFFIFLVGLFLLFQKPKINIKYILIGFLIGIIPLVPYFYFVLQDNCRECDLLFNVMKEKLSMRNLEVFARPFQILNQGNFRYVIGGYTATFAQHFPLAYKLKWLFYSEYIFLPIGALLFWKNYKKFRFFLYASLGTTVLYFLFGIEAKIHYFIVIAPLLFLFLGTVFNFLIKSKNLPVARVFLFFFSTLILYSIIFNFSFYKFIRKFGSNMDGDYGLPLNLSRQDIKDKFIKYKNDPEYQQILISSYIPLYIMRGTSPFAKMIYPYDQTRQNLLELEEKLKNQPQDPRILHQLNSYYTTTDPQAQTIEYLRQKTKILPEFAPIYNDIYSSYLQKKLKKVHISKKFKFLVEYPQHWEDLEIDDKVILKSSDYYIRIEADPKNFDSLMSREKFKTATYVATKTTVLNVDTEKTECITPDNKWCGIIYSRILFNGKTFLIAYNYSENKNIELKNITDRDLLFAIESMDEIVQSIREL